MTRFNTQFSVEVISFLNLVMALSSSVKFKYYLCNQVIDITGHEVSPTKQARGDSGKEPKLHRWQNGEKTLGENRLSRGGSSPLARRISSLFQLELIQIVRAPLEQTADSSGQRGTAPPRLSQWSFPDGCLGDGVLTGDLSLGLIYVS